MRNLLSCFVLCLSLAASDQSYGANWYVRSAAQGTHSGADWNNAWTLSSIGWGSVGPGDVVYVGGGSYSGELDLSKAGSSGNPIVIQRVRTTDTAATQAAGWNSSFDSQVIQQVPNGGSGIVLDASNVTVDGRVLQGWQLNLSDNSSGVEATDVGYSNVTLRYIYARGPGVINQSSDVRGFDLTPAGGSQANLVMQYCETGNGGDSGMYLLNTTNALIEHCSFHDAGATNAATFHPNIIYCGQITNSTFRYNKLYNIEVEGIFFGDSGNTDIKIYGNLFYQGSIPQNSGRAIEFDNASSGNSGLLIYNNTFVNLPLGVRLNSAAGFSNCAFSGNLLFQDSAQFQSGWTQTGNLTTTSDPFVNSGNFDYHLQGSNGAAPNLGSPYNIDFDGLSRSSQGPWDAGAYSYNGAPTPTPTGTPSVTPSPISTPTPSPTATTTPSPDVTPNPNSQFAIGQQVSMMNVVNIRATPAGALLGTKSSGSIGTIQAGPTTASLNGSPVTWYQVTFSTGPNGWVGADNFGAVLNPTPTPSPSPKPTPVAVTFVTWQAKLSAEYILKPNEAQLKAWLKANPPVAD